MFSKGRAYTGFGVMIAFVAMGQIAHADCATRHFYNNSGTPFQVDMGNAAKCSVGTSGMQTTCIIPGKSAGDLHYHDGGSSKITIQSKDGGNIYPAKEFFVESTCYIDHDGNTGNIVVNSDADGDVATCGNRNYPCQVPH